MGDPAARVVVEATAEIGKRIAERHVDQGRRVFVTSRSFDRLRIGRRSCQSHIKTPHIPRGPLPLMDGRGLLRLTYFEDARLVGVVESCPRYGGNPRYCGRTDPQALKRAS